MISRMSDLKRCYEILDIKPGSSYEEARLAFRDLVSIWHPDKFSHNTRLKEKAEEKLKDLNSAWEQLQVFFLQKKNAAAEQHVMEQAEPEKTHMFHERKHRERDGKTEKSDCSFTDLEFEPLVHFELARKAYRHRHSRHHDPDDPQSVVSHSNGVESEGICPQKNTGVGEQCEIAQQQGIRLLLHGQGESNVTRRIPDEHESREIKTGAVKPHGRVDKEPAHGKKATQHSLDDSFNEKDRKIRLLSDSYWLGSLERKYVNWQQRERENKKQQDAVKEIAIKNKKLADLFLTRYKIWLAKEKSKYKSSPTIRSLFKINTSTIWGGESQEVSLWRP